MSRLELTPPFPQSPPSRRRTRPKKTTKLCSNQSKVELRNFAQQDDIPVLLYRRGTRSYPPMTPSFMQRAAKPVWFAVGSQRSTYGRVIVTYALKRTPLLYNVGSHAARNLVFQLALNSKRWTENYLDRVFNADFQWSGTAENAETTSVFRAVLEPCGFDGTFVGKHADEDLLGAEEIVLWRNFSALLKKY